MPVTVNMKTIKFASKEGNINSNKIIFFEYMRHLITL